MCESACACKARLRLAADKSAMVAVIHRDRAERAERAAVAEVGDVMARLSAMLAAPCANPWALPEVAALLKCAVLGGGAFGTAFAVSPTLVLKLTTSEREYECAQVLKGKTPKYTWSIYSCGKFNEAERLAYGKAFKRFTGCRRIYWIMGERLLPLTQKQRDSIQWGNKRHRMLQSRTNKELNLWNIRHSDAHTGNLLRTKTNRLKFVDVQ